MGQSKIKRAIISVSNKDNIIEFAEKLASFGVEIISTGGTAETLLKAGIKVVKVSDFTGFPEIMDGRVKTLHPKIYGGILARAKDSDVIEEFDIKRIDMIVVNLYPFEKTISNSNSSYEDAIENIDIGGPTMIRAGAKNHKQVCVLTDPSDYQLISVEMDRQNGEVSFVTRKQLATKAFATTSIYDAQIANYFAQSQAETKDTKNKDNLKLPDIYINAYQKKQNLRYGENPHQKASVYKSITNKVTGIIDAKLLQGKELSYNNLADANAAVACVYEFDELACTIVKHANPCGVSQGDNLLSAYAGAYNCDPVSAFGGVIAFNRGIDCTVAKQIINQQFVEVIIAPTISSSALEVLSEKPNVRVLSLGSNYKTATIGTIMHSISGGLLVQDLDSFNISKENLQIVTKREPTTNELHDLLFSYKVVKHIKSNAIVFVKNQRTLGIGCGQSSRVHSSLIAGIKAKEQNFDLSGSVMASDAFFPFRDGLDNAIKCGATAIIQPGGSIRDEEIIQAANESNIAMIFTGIRHFKH